LDTKNEERAFAHRTEHQNFVEEFRAEQKALKLLLRKVILKSQDNDITFSPDESGVQTNEDQQDISFDNL
jgi:hypothetical protein